MQAIAKLRGIKGSPQKARLVIDLIRGRNVSQALAILKFTNKRAAHPIAKCLNSAIANATYMAERQNIAIDPEDLWVKTCFVDMGPHKNRRRMRPAPQGRAYREQRHYCHITIEVSSEDSPDKKKLKYSPNVKNVDTPISGDKVKVKGKAEKEVLKETDATENAEKETKTDSAEKAVKTESAVLGEEVKGFDKAPENTDVTGDAPEVVSGKETDTGETDTPFENKPLAAQTDEEKTGTDMAADAKIDKVEELEKQ